jgi:UPF0755 protein
VRNILSRKNREWPQIVVVVIFVILAIGIGGAMIARHTYTNDLKPLSSGQHTVSVSIPQGATLKDVAALLKKQKIIKSDWAFAQYVRNKQAADKIKAGTYELSPSQSAPEIVSIITEGKVATNLITILPGQRLDQIKKTFVNSGFSPAEVDSAFNPDNYINHPALVDKPVGASLEGYLYPESFQKTNDTTPQDIVKESLDEMQKRLTPDLRAAIEARGLTVHQGITMASIVEREADKAADRNQVAQVFYARLGKGMKLQSDATALYGAAIAGQPLSVTYSSAYNTYENSGLPPGPISNVTESSLQAVAHPANTTYLYFVAGDDGTVHFASTPEEHDAQVSQFCHKLCSQ